MGCNYLSLPLLPASGATVLIDLSIFFKAASQAPTVYPTKYAHGFCFAVLCCVYTWTDFPISIRLTSLALWQSNDCPSASKATLMNMDKYFMWIHYERLYNHNKAKDNKTVCIFLGIYCRHYCHMASEVTLYRVSKINQTRAITTIRTLETLDPVSL